MAYHGADPEAAGADMRTDAHSEREIDEFQIRESLLELIFIILQFIGVHVRIGDADLQPSALTQMGQPAAISASRASSIVRKADFIPLALA